jgi:hypothetical protein
LKADIACLWLPDQKRTALSCTHVETSENAGDMSLFINESRRIKPRARIRIARNSLGEKRTGLAAEYGSRRKISARRICGDRRLHSAVGFPIKINKKFYGVIDFLRAVRCSRIKI